MGDRISRNLILASSSEARMALLKSGGFKISKYLSPELDESPFKKEKPPQMAKRLAKEKALKALSMLNDEEKTSAVIIAADTVSFAGTRVADKALKNEDIVNNMKLLSGKNHKVFTAYCVIYYEENDGANYKMIEKDDTTRITFKRFTDEEISLLTKSGEGLNKSGGYAIVGMIQNYTLRINGCLSTILGLPMHKLVKNLAPLGIKPSII